MEESKFFKFIWRVNGLLIFGLALCLALVLSYQFIKKLTRNNAGLQPPVVENIASDPEDKEKWVIGGRIKIIGNDFVMLPLISKNKEVKNLRQDKMAMFSQQTESASYYRTDPTKNILFLNTSTNESFWLFDDTKRLITSTSLFPERYQGKKPTKAIFYNVVSLVSG